MSKLISTTFVLTRDQKDFLFWLAQARRLYRSGVASSSAALRYCLDAFHKDGDIRYPYQRLRGNSPGGWCSLRIRREHQGTISRVMVEQDLKSRSAAVQWMLERVQEWDCAQEWDNAWDGTGKEP